MKLTNTLSGKKEDFIPLKEKEVSLYICGITLYDDIHIGHLKSIVAFEVMRNYFEYLGYKTTLVRNITDVDDKIIAKAVSLNRAPLDLVNQYVYRFHELLNKLGIRPPDKEPRVTHYLEEIDSYVEDLIKEGKAYQTSDGIYFDTNLKPIEKYPLSKKIVRDLENHTRLENHDKKNKGDFALWKEDEKYGFKSNVFSKLGRPGWHIECSVMHYHTLGKKFDIHGGGRDLIFPHHENEILQSVAHNGVNPANYWLHNGMMTKDGKKLSKSFGNSIYVKDLIEKYSPEGIKLFLNKGQYHQAQEFNELELKEAHERWQQFVQGIQSYTLENTYDSILDKVIHALEDDFNTPQVVVILYGAFKELQIKKSKYLAQEIVIVLKLLSVLPHEVTLENLLGKHIQEVPQDIQQLLEKRQLARNNKDYKTSDQLRKILQEKGWYVQDGTGKILKR